MPDYSSIESIQHDLHQKARRVTRQYAVLRALTELDPKDSDLSLPYVEMLRRLQGVIQEELNTLAEKGTTHGE